MDQLIKKAEKLSKQEKYEQAFDLLLEADRKGQAIASYALGTWYLHGRFVKKDLQKGVRFLIKATKGKVKEAYFDLAICYEKGAGTKKDLQKAFKNYVRASVLGDKDSIYEVIRCIYYGIGTEENKELSSLLYDKHFRNDYPKKEQKEKKPRKRVKVNSALNE